LVQGEPREAWILRMGVREDQRRNGVGSILLSELLEVFRTLGARTVRLTVSPWNVPALGLYLKSGFEQETYHEAYFGKDEDRIVMVKEME
jgi:ribosomal protein S18 acetylase RimI-like enzyme